jgi:hypothetical protein
MAETEDAGAVAEAPAAEEKREHVVSTKNTFVIVEGKESPIQGAECRSAPTVYRTPAADAPPQTPEYWSVQPGIEAPEGMPSATAEGMPFPTLGLDEDVGVGAYPVVPLPSPPVQEESECIESFKSCLAGMFRHLSGVLFLASREYPFCFNVRLRLPPSAPLEEAAKRVARKGNYPRESLHIVQAHIRSAQFLVWLQLLPLPKSQYNMCWDQTKSPSGTCPKAEMGKCRWNHMPLVTITVALEHGVAPPRAEVDMSPSLIKNKPLKEGMKEEQYPEKNSSGSTAETTPGSRTESADDDS